MRVIERTVRAVILAILAGSSAGCDRSEPATATTAPYFGVWKCNVEKSDLGPVRMSIEDRGGTFIHTDLIRNKSYTFRMDGQGYTDPDGFTATWTPQGARAWQATYIGNGKEAGTEVYSLDESGDRLRIRFTMADTPPVESTVTRTAGPSGGLPGSWEGKLVPPEFELHIQPDGRDGLLWRIPGAFETRARFDGKPYPMTGPLILRPTTSAFTRSGDRSFHNIAVEGTTQMIDATYSVSDDGRTLTERAIAEGGMKRTWVFERIR